MGLPAYYTEDSSPVTPVLLPISWDPLSNPYEITRDQIKLETERGIIFEYEMSTRASPTFIFTIPESLLAEFRTMYNAVVGSAFFFIPDADVSPSGVMHVRIKDPTGFMVEPFGVFLVEGQAEQLFRYQLKLIEEITAAEIVD